jgi:uncharacterized membrane protein YgcG
MAYADDNCSCGNTLLMARDGRCVSCGDISCDGCLDEITQKRIWNQVRVPSSLYTMNLATMYIVDGRTTDVNWNQSSDRQVPSIGTYYVPSRGNTTKGTVTRNRPGASGSAGTGVDIKHNSYARYLARKKGKNIKTNTTEVAPIIGNKTRTYGIISACVCDGNRQEQERERKRKREQEQEQQGGGGSGSGGSGSGGSGSGGSGSGGSGSGG